MSKLRKTNFGKKRSSQNNLAQQYINRVQADGGYVFDKQFINDAYNILEDNNLLNHLHHWSDYRAGKRTSFAAVNRVGKLYSLDNYPTDLTQTTEASAPVYNGENLNFDNNDEMNILGLSASFKSMTVILKIYNNFTNNFYPLWSMGSSNALQLHSEAGGGIYGGTNLNDRFTPSDLPDGTIQQNTLRTYSFTFKQAEAPATKGTAKFYRDSTLLASKPMADSTDLLANVRLSKLDSVFYSYKIFKKELSLSELQIVNNL